MRWVQDAVSGALGGRRLQASIRVRHASQGAPGSRPDFGANLFEAFSLLSHSNVICVLSPNIPYTLNSLRLGQGRIVFRRVDNLTRPSSTWKCEL